MSSQNILKTLEITFGTIPKIIDDNMKYLNYCEENDHFVCIPCDKTIKKNDYNVNSTTKNFESHLLSNTHKCNTISSDELWANLKLTFPERIPQIVHNNFYVLGMDGKDYECAICRKCIKVSTNVFATENNFSYHLLSNAHENNLEEYRDALSQLHGVYGNIPLFVLNHCQFLSQNGRHYFCNLCEKHIAVHPSNLVETEKIFEAHLHSLKHMRNAKQAKAFSLLPELKQIFNKLPNYMLRSIEYICVNGPNYFCSLCNENIKFNRRDLYETEQNFKFHNLSTTHEENLSNRRDSENEVFNHIQSLFESLPDAVLENIKYICLSDDDFFCKICQTPIYQDEDTDQTKANLTTHFESIYHQDTVQNEFSRQQTVIEELEDVFGSIPELIKDNIQHIIFQGGIDFNCTLCNKIMKCKINGDDYETNTSTTERNFFSHLNSHGHTEELELMENTDDDVYKDIEELFTPVPQFITNNLEHLSFGDDDSDDFHCVLCDKTIALVSGNKKGELTEQNFRSHLLSSGHMAKLKQNANSIMEATDMLESVFNRVPTFVLSNIEHISIYCDRFLCTLCDVQIMRGGAESTEKRFRDHLNGNNHKSNLKALEVSADEALQQLDSSFWRIPEFLLRNIDFLINADNDLYCILCQENLSIDEDDLETTKQSLRDHMDSEQHQFNLRNM